MTVEEMFFDMVEAFDYHRGFADHSEETCILMQIYAEALYC